MGWARWAYLLYTSDAADEEDSVDLGGRRIILRTSVLGRLVSCFFNLMFFRSAPG